MNGLDRKQAFCEPFPLSFASNANNHPIPVDRCQLTFTLVTLLTVSIYSQTSLSRAEPADLLTRLSLGEISLPLTVTQYPLQPWHRRRPTLWVSTTGWERRLVKDRSE